ncbi:MAG: hypothetical protein Kow0096_16390 [Thiohalomonadaceae bacterium]
MADKSMILLAFVCGIASTAGAGMHRPESISTLSRRVSSYMCRAVATNSAYPVVLLFYPDTEVGYAMGAVQSPEWRI